MKPLSSKPSDIYLISVFVTNSMKKFVNSMNQHQNQISRIFFVKPNDDTIENVFTEILQVRNFLAFDFNDAFLKKMWKILILGHVSDFKIS